MILEQDLHNKRWRISLLLSVVERNFAQKKNYKKTYKKEQKTSQPKNTEKNRRAHKKGEKEKTPKHFNDAVSLLWQLNCYGAKTEELRRRGTAFYHPLQKEQEAGELLEDTQNTRTSKIELTVYIALKIRELLNYLMFYLFEWY